MNEPIEVLAPKDLLKICKNAARLSNSVRISLSEELPISIEHYVDDFGLIRYLFSKKKEESE